MEAHLKAMVKTRASLKGQMTKMVTWVQAITDVDQIDAFNSRLNRAKELLKTFEQIEISIFELDSQQDSGIIDFSEQYFVVESRLSQLIREYNDTHGNEGGKIFNTSINNSMNMHTEVKLPKIYIEPFTGNYTEWQSFYDLYLKTIHDNTALGAVQKFQYLKGLLKGEAANLVKHFNITENNYFEAFKKLKERYDRKSHTIKAFIRAFIDQPVVQNPSSTTIRRLLDTSDEVIRGLAALGSDGTSRDPWLLYILVEKLDSETRSLWAQESCEDTPTLKSFFKFLLNRADALESVNSINTKRTTYIGRSKPSRSYVSTYEGSGPVCPICKANHFIIECGKFKEMTVDERRQCIKADGRCFNCLNQNHGVFRCLAKPKCTKCTRKHHALLHPDDSPRFEEEADTSAGSDRDQQSTSCAHANSTHQIVLLTAEVDVIGNYGELHKCRVLMDSGSMSSFVTEKFCNQLRIKRKPCHTIISGIGNSSQQVAKGSVKLVLKSKYNHTLINVEALVLPQLSGELPRQPIDVDFSSLPTIFLADPNFNIPGKVDILLGIEHVFNLLRGGRLQQKGRTVAVESDLGWILGGTIESNIRCSQSYSSITEPKVFDIDATLRKFWEVEELPIKPMITAEEEACEQLFQTTTTRDKDGRYVVELPFNKRKEHLGESVWMAKTRLMSIERRMRGDQSFSKAYHDFMSEYKELGHMSKITNDQTGTVYIPHHGVLKLDSSSTKLRVVFDASSKTSSGVALNDTLMVGPRVQPTLQEILLRFRKFRVAIVSDIEKMYRQILVKEDHRRYQTIIWRDSERSDLVRYQLNTVTYGTAAAPFLATRVLKEIAMVNQDKYPLAYQVLMENTYVDDVMAGADDEHHAIELKNQVVTVLSNSGMKLRKWISNSKDFLETIPKEDREQHFRVVEDREATVKVLGLQWDPEKDVFTYKVKLGEPSYTKRGMLSESSKIFDPLGWLTPVTLHIKGLFQSIWTTPTKWDDELPHNIKESWVIIRNNLSILQNIQIPRWLRGVPNVHLHGFSDASTRGYAAAIYALYRKINGEFECMLVTAKSKVSPIKVVSIARLELCGAHLLTKLLISTAEVLRINKKQLTAWTDSTIVLDWLSDHPARWTTFVGNRTSQILEYIRRDQWLHVPGSMNPADPASRGIFPQELPTLDIWWKGPEFLTKPMEEWPAQRKAYGTAEEQKPKWIESFIAEVKTSIYEELLVRYSSWNKLLMVVAVILRFITNAKVKQKENRKGGPIGIEDIENSIKWCCKQDQRIYLQTEIMAIQKGREPREGLKCLCPVIDHEELLRVGGRLQKSELSEDAKHPIIISSNSRFAELIVLHYHTHYHHSGIQLTLSFIRQKFWIIRGKSLIKKMIKQCVKCFKANPKPQNQQMGELPTDRVQLVRPFLKVGVDYAGPIQAYVKRSRGQRAIKVYLCIFVCFSSKAVHIEVVHDLTTESFLAALKRFVSRRGLCSDIYSDCGSNFIGARNQMAELYKFIEKNNHSIYYNLLKERISWHFNPPNAPHFGGLWEAAVKSFKTQLRRVMGQTILSLDELQTLLIEIEAILNSRPLAILSGDELGMLTPAHFIIGHPLTLVPEGDITDVKLNTLSRWQLIQQFKQNFWRRWHMEYLTTLQSRQKWTKIQNNIKIGDIVLMQDNTLPPTKWLLGKIQKITCGTDGLIRVCRS